MFEALSRGSKTASFAEPRARSSLRAAGEGLQPKVEIS